MSRSAPSPPTNTLDHIVHLCPPGDLETSCRAFRDLGFKVLPGGTHADGLTHNALIVLPSGIYIELISFTHPVDWYPQGSDERQQREAHRWAKKEPGWMDFAFLGNGSTSIKISDVVNERAAEHGLEPIYANEVDGGRIRPDGVELRWLITCPLHEPSPLPFFCGDMTPRHLRVPSKPPSHVSHPCTALDVCEIVVLTDKRRFAALSHRLMDTLGIPPIEEAEFERAFMIQSPESNEYSRKLILRAQDSISPTNSISSLTFLVSQLPSTGSNTTPYSKVYWRQA